MFLSKKIKHTFTGYAFSQLKALQRHREWFLNPPSKKPERKDFGLSDSPSASMAWINSLKDTLNYNLLRPDIVDEVRREREYREEKRKWDNFVQWQTNRNPSRKASEEKFGYDGKYASHIFRLMIEGRDLLLNGFITFPLHESKWLLDIKNGKYTYEEIISMADELEKDFEGWYEQSTLPKSPNINALKKLYFEILEV